MPQFCPNKIPKFAPDYRIAIVGEHPGEDELSIGEPFSGSSGRILNGCLSSAGIDRNQVMLANVSQFNSMSADDIEHGSAQLEADLKRFNPNIVVLLGDRVLKLAGGRHKVSDYRGSLFTCVDTSSPFFNRKCIATYHPAFILRAWDKMPLLGLDLERALDQATSPELTLPDRRYELVLTTEQVLSYLDAIKPGDIISLDIEGGIQQGMTCVSIATSPTHAFIIAFTRYSLEDECRIMRRFAEVMIDPTIGKVLQNSLYDNFVLSWMYHCPIVNVIWDTMLSGWEIYPELPKSLGVQTSIWTLEPYYKFERKIDDALTHYEYCCKDSAVTYEIYLKHQSHMSEAQLSHFRFNMSLLPLFLYIELRGILYDQPHADRQLAVCNVKLAEIQTRVNNVAKQCLLDSINLNSPKQVCDLLYNRLCLPKQHPKVGIRKDTSRTTANVDALLTLAKKFPELQIIRDILAFRKLDKTREALEIKCDSDTRVRASYNVVGTDTGRLTCQKSPAGTGMNLQTVTKKLRNLFRADDDHYFFQLDLAGADGWTVAAHCKALGDETMMLDYLAGIKPAKVIVLMYRHGSEVASWPRDKIKSESRTVSEEGPEGWLYFTAKRVQHGTNYELGKNTMSAQILKDSYNRLGKPIYVSPAECAKLQQLYITYRYSGVRRWQQWVKTQLEQHQRLSCASGHIRTFFGRRSDHNTYRTALSHEPQANTTYATNLAMSRLWNDEQNRDPSNNLYIQPLHQVHDAALGQFPKDRLDWAIARLRSYFDNPILIADQQITIPFDGGYGPSWGELTTEI